MNQIFSLWALLALVAVLAGCKSQPSVTVEDPRGYLMEKLTNMEHNAWWHPYRITDEAFISDFLDERIAKEREWKEGLPTDDKSLDKFLFRIKGGLTNAHTATPEARARVLENIKWRYANPQVKRARKKETYPGIAIVDFGYIPGKWQEGRGGWSLKSLGTESFDLAPADIARGYKLANEAYPEASTYLVTSRVYFGSSRHHSEYQYDTTSGRLFYVHNTSHSYSRETYPIEKVIAGEISPSDVEMDGVGEQAIASPLIINMRPLEDPHDYLMDYVQK